MHTIAYNKSHQTDNSSWISYDNKMKMITCPRCTYRHQHGKCRAKTEYCHACHHKGHYRNTSYCKYIDIRKYSFPSQQALQLTQDQQVVNQLDVNYLDDILGISINDDITAQQLKADLD